MVTTDAPAFIRLGPPGAPALTLGWPVLGWTREYLQQPDGPKYREPWNYTDEQARFVLNWFGIDEQGDWLYRYAMLRRMKGWGKDPFGATLCSVEFIGPCRFGGWNQGEPIAVPNPAGWVQTAAVSKEQTRNTMTLFPGLFTAKAIEEFALDIGKEIIYADGGRRRIEAVTSSPRALEGPRATFVLKNETHHWIESNDGHAMSAVIARNIAKSRDGAARVLAISNAHAPGEDSDAERDYEAMRLGTEGLLYDSLEAPDVDLKDDGQVLRAIPKGDSVWVSEKRLLAEIRDPRTSPAMARRFYLNQIVAEEDKPFDKDRWAQLVRHPYYVTDGSLITLGFDGSLKRDHTALIGTEVETGYQWVVGYWEPEQMSDGEWRIDFDAVNETVDDAFTRWRVWRMNADPYKWGGYISAWAGKYGSDIVWSWPTTSYRKMAHALAQYRIAQMNGEMSHDGDPRFAAAIANSHKHMQQFRDDDGEPMWTIQKERPDSPLKIDAAVAGCLSWEARMAAITSGEPLKEEPVTVEFW